MSSNKLMFLINFNLCCFTGSYILGVQMFGVTMRNSCFREFSNVPNHRYCSRAFCDWLWKHINSSDSLFIIPGPLQVDIMSLKYQNVVECGLGFNRICFFPKAFHENTVFYLDIGKCTVFHDKCFFVDPVAAHGPQLSEKILFFLRSALSCSRYCRLQNNISLPTSW